MKRSFIIILLTVISVHAMAQLTGSGLASDPYSGGTLVSELTWSPSSDTVYISGTITIGTSGHLIITNGVFVKFLFSNVNIIITNTGRITAQGLSSSKIFFTADHNRNKNHGETGERWGHISFQEMSLDAGASIFEHCIIEYGDVSTASGSDNPNKYGGAMHLDFSNIIITNCEFRFNKAGWGGAIFVGDGRNPSITDCYIHNNIATTSGGGLYFWRNSSSDCINTIIIENSCTGPGGGGGIFLGGAAKGVRFINCLISSNTAASQAAGHNIKFHNNSATPKPQFINSIIWGPANSIVGSIYDADFLYCAIQDPPRATYTGLVSLNSLNEGSNPSGPFFDSMSGDSWPLQFNSPLRDTGTNIGAPLLDYLGQPTVYTKDIGAFEYQYSRWRTDAGSTDWTTDANWDGGVPNSSRDVVIPSGVTNYPIGATAPDVIIGSGKYFIMEPGSRATIDGLTNSGILQLRASSAAFSSLILGSYTRGAGGSEEIDVYLTGGGTEENDDYRWHYISSPVSSLDTSTFTSVTLDLAQFVESLPTLSVREGWVAADGYVYSTGQLDGPTFNTLTTGTNGKGYNYFFNQDRTYTFGGLLNTSSVTAPLGFSGTPAIHGFNLLGNPFISGLDWNYIIADINYPDSTSKSLYFTRNNQQCSFVAGVGIPGDVSGIIPPMQGFFTKTYTKSKSITLPIAARTHDNIHARYKGSETVIPLVRLALTGTDKTDETVVRFDESAKSGLDNNFDALKMFISESATYLYTLTEEVKYAINGQPFPEEILEVPVVMNVISSGTHTISATQLQGLENYRVRLKDLELNTITDLKQFPTYQFAEDKGLIADRFVIQISDLALGQETIGLEEQSVNIYAFGGIINIVPLNEVWDGKVATIRIIDLSGRNITALSNVELNQGIVTTVPAPTVNGIYFVEISSGIMRHAGKVVIK